jgi:hypothetical protein
MIRYSSMTLGQAQDEVMLRLGQQRVAINLDSQTVQTFINRARREVLNKTLPYKDWAYVLNNVPVRHGEKLPEVDVSTFLSPEGWTEPRIDDDGNPTETVPLSWIFIKPIRCLLRPVGSAPEVEYEEARYIDPKEYFVMSDWRSRQSWNSATQIYPTYTMWGAKTNPSVSTPDDHLYFYASPNADAQGYMNWQTGTAPEGFKYHTHNMEGLMDCYVGYPETYNLTDKLLIPYEFENLLIVYTMMRCLAKVGNSARLKQYHENSVAEQKRLREMFATSKINVKRNLESLADVRGQQAQQQRGE